MQKLQAGDVIQTISRLQHAERQASAADVRADIAAARELLEQLVGPTVRPALAARLFGVTHAALLPWIKRSEIATVLTPEGKREIPLAEVIDLLEDVSRARSAGESRPLSRVIGERARRAEESIDVDRLLPRRPRGHRASELQSLAYHRLVAERLDGQMLDDVRRRLERWRTDERIHPYWLSEWERVVSLPRPQVARRISADTASGRELRQSSPFAGLLNQQELRHLHQAVETRARA